MARMGYGLVQDQFMDRLVAQTAFLAIHSEVWERDVNVQRLRDGKASEREIVSVPRVLMHISQVTVGLAIQPMTPTHVGAHRRTDTAVAGKSVKTTPSVRVTNKVERNKCEAELQIASYSMSQLLVHKTLEKDGVAPTAIEESPGGKF